MVVYKYDTLNLEKRYDFNFITEFVFLKNMAFCPTIGAKPPFRWGKTSHSQIKFFFQKILILMPKNNNPVRSDILFDFYK